MDEIDRKSVDIELPFRIGNCNNIYILNCICHII